MTEISDNLNNENRSVAPSKHRGGSLLLREDFDSGPVSLDLVDKGLWLGNLKAACDLVTLQNLNISHILTVDAVPLPRMVAESTNIVTKYIQVADVPKQDLISHFTETNEFISQGVREGTVLVHCYFGMSRSAAVVIAYMMAAHSMSFEEAFYVVKAKRNITCPNSGFIAQLKLYGRMGCHLDKEHPRYKQFRLRMAAENVKKVRILPQICADLVKPDPGLTRERPDPHVYRCKKCRRIVASQTNIIPHIPQAVRLAMGRRPLMKDQDAAKTNVSNKCDLAFVQNGQILIEKLKSLTCGNENKDNEHNLPVLNYAQCDTEQQNKTSSTLEGVEIGSEEIIVMDNDTMGTNNIADSQDCPEVCVQTYFVEPLAWMKDVHRNVQGKLHCPKCSNKLGSFSWIMGCQCPCGVKVAPAFYLVPSKVEWSNVVQNVQVTV